jgi:PKD repeat protein
MVWYFLEEKSPTLALLFTKQHRSSMRLLITLLTLLQSALLFAQTADVSTGCAPLPVKFTPPAGATAFFWTFQDGGSSNLASPTNIFTTAGTYDVEFRETPAGPVVGTVSITVYPKPEIGFTATPESGCIPLNVQFNDTTQLAGDIQVTAFSWVFGDGGNGTGTSPTHLYNTVGSFTVSLELTTNYSTCNVTQVFLNRIRTGIKPVVGFSTVPSPAIACVPPLNVSFDNTTTGGSGSLTYTWDFGNGNTSNLVDPPAQTYTQLGNFTVTLTATDAVGCSATASSTVSIGVPVADFFSARHRLPRCCRAVCQYIGARHLPVVVWAIRQSRYVHRPQPIGRIQCTGQPKHLAHGNHRRQLYQLSYQNNICGRGQRQLHRRTNIFL